jgi:hypothetical protein
VFAAWASSPIFMGLLVLSLCCGVAEGHPACAAA